MIDETSGRVIGVNTAVISKDIAEGLHLAIAIDQVTALFGQYLTQ